MKKLVLLSLTIFLANGLLFGQLLTQPPASTDNDEVYKVVERMPMFNSPACDSMEDKITCSKMALHDFIYDNMVYPEMARKDGVEGTVYARFTVEKDGSITDAKILRDNGAGCGDEVLRLLSIMPKWIPGKQRDRLVRCYYHVAVKFMLKKKKPVRPPFNPN